MAKDFSVIGRALSAPARSVIVDALMDGSARPAGELAALAGISASTASEHLTVLIDAGVVACTSRGRQRFYRIADGSIAAAFESLGQLCPDVPVNSFQRSRDAQNLSEARLCYDHLAGRLGVALSDSLVRRGWIESSSFALLEDGEQSLSRLGIDVTALSGSRRPLTRQCPDWTERRNHLAGALGAVIAQHFIDNDMVRRRRQGRGLVVTQNGADVIRQEWGAEFEPTQVRARLAGRRSNA